MARRRDYDEEMTQTGRISPYDQIPEEEYEADYDDGYDQEYDDQAYDGEYDDRAYDDEAYDDEAYDEEYDGEYDEDGDDEEQEGLLSSLPAKIILAVIVLLIVILAALLAMRLLRRPGGEQLPDGDASQTVTIDQADEQNTIVFAPAENTPEPTSEPTAVPEPTATELPIILTNTPTPSPTATPTPTPSPTPIPTPTPKPSPTAVPELSKGEVNRNANLRESATASGKVKQTVKDGEAVTIHEAVLDKTGKIWYSLTVDDLEISGWMRDYVVDTAEKIAAPTYTPRPEATPGADDEEAEKDENTSKALNENAIGTGKTNKDANVRKIMNGKVVTQLRKGRRVDILSVKMDKNGDLWYEVQPQGLSTIGFIRDYLVTLDRGVELILPTATPKAEKTPDPDGDAEASEETGDAVVEDTKKDSILDREVIGRARTNRAANVRVEPKAGAKLVRQLSKGNWLHILAVYQDDDNALWYEVSTESGKTSGFVRDYVVELHELDDGVEAKVYGEEEPAETEAE